MYKTDSRLPLLPILTAAWLLGWGGCASVPEAKVDHFTFPSKSVFVGDVNRPYTVLGPVRSKVDFTSLDSGHEERELCKNYYTKSARELLKYARTQGADAVIDMQSVVFLQDGRRETYKTPECSDDGGEGQILTQGVAVKWKTEGTETGTWTAPPTAPTTAPAILPSVAKSNGSVANTTVPPQKIGGMHSGMAELSDPNLEMNRLENEAAPPSPHFISESVPPVFMPAAPTSAIAFPPEAAPLRTSPASAYEATAPAQVAASTAPLSSVAPSSTAASKPAVIEMKPHVAPLAGEPAELPVKNSAAAPIPAPVTAQFKTLAKPHSESRPPVRVNLGDPRATFSNFAEE
jgi:hypothetical protein